MSETTNQSFARLSKVARRLNGPQSDEAANTLCLVKRAFHSGRRVAARSLVREWAAEHPLPVRRTAAEIEAARDALANALSDCWAKAPEGAAPSDLAALVKAGRLERVVRTEYDRQEVRDDLFGNTGQVQRRRAYYRAV